MQEINRNKFYSFVLVFRFLCLIGSICHLMLYIIIFTKKFFIHISKCRILIIIQYSKINKKSRKESTDLICQRLRLRELYVLNFLIFWITAHYFVFLPTVIIE